MTSPLAPRRDAGVAFDRFARTDCCGTRVSLLVEEASRGRWRGGGVSRGSGRRLRDDSRYGGGGGPAARVAVGTHDGGGPRRRIVILVRRARFFVSLSLSQVDDGSAAVLDFFPSRIGASTEGKCKLFR